MQVSDLKYAVSFPVDYYRGLRAVSRSDQPDIGTHKFDQPHVIVDLRTSGMLFDLGRYLYAFVEAFRQTGVKVRFLKNRWFLARAGRKYYGRAALSLPNVNAQWLQSSRGPLIGRLSDQDPANTPLIFGDAYVEGADVFPYPMHPLVYDSANLDELRQRRKTPTHPRVFFSGNANHKYDNRALESKFGVTSRAKVIAALRADFKTSPLPHPNKQADLDALLDASAAGAVVINDSRQCRIPNERWLETLSRFDYFLCCPGVSHPCCHNAIEAMCVGTIPIIEFPELFSPPLKNDVNAICFRGLNGLSEAFERALDMSAAQREKMSRQVVRYYQDHLCIRRFTEAWLEQGARRPIHFPFIPAAS